MPERIGDCLCRVVDERELGAALEEVGVVEAEEGDPGLLGVGGGLRGESGQLLFGLVVAAFHVGGLGGEEVGVEAGAVVDGGAGQPFGEGMVVAGTRRDRTGQEELGAAATTDETPRRHQQGVLAAPCAGRLGHLGPGAGEVPLAQGTDADAHHIPVDGMAERDLNPTAVDAAGDQPPAFEGLHGRGVGQRGQGRLVERLAEREELQHGPLGIGEVTQPLRHQFDQAARGLQGAPQAPDPDHLLDERAGLDRPGHQLAQEQRVALAVFGQLAHRSPAPPARRAPSPAARRSSCRPGRRARCVPPGRPSTVPRPGRARPPLTARWPPPWRLGSGPAGGPAWPTRRRGDGRRRRTPPADAPRPPPPPPGGSGAGARRAHPGPGDRRPGRAAVGKRTPRTATPATLGWRSCGRATCPVPGPAARRRWPASSCPPRRAR